MTPKRPLDALSSTTAPRPAGDRAGQPPAQEPLGHAEGQAGPVPRQNPPGKRVDYWAASVIVIGPTLQLPTSAALARSSAASSLFKPFAMKRLVDTELA